MKVSYNWLKELVDFDLPPPNELAARIGAQLGAVEEVIELGPKYRSIRVVKVVECRPLENSDHLKVCLIDDAAITPDVNRQENGLVQVVCGAPNVRAGQLVAWLPPGSTVPATYGKEPFVLEARPLRGVVSNGMLASGAELAIGTDHNGLLILADEANATTEDAVIKPGDDFAAAFGLDDYIIEIENKMFTHRPDCFGMLGIAREVAGILGRSFRSPEVYLAKSSDAAPSADSLLEIRNEIPQLVPRFTAQVFQNITIGPSPVWLQTRLARLGLRPINNIVDLTNYYMMLTGQPTHAYDYDKLKALDGGDQAALVIRAPGTGEKLTLLNGKTVEPGDDTILIASATKPVGLGGVMGGAETEVDGQTRNIVLESASFDMYAIRRTSMELGIFSDAVTRFNKGQSPLQTGRVLNWLAADLLRLAGGQTSGVLEAAQLPPEILESDSLHPAVTVAADFINARLGLSLAVGEMAELLANVEFAVEVHDSELTVKPPFWRTDIQLPEDIVEEIGRLYGFDKLPLELPTRPIQPAAKDSSLTLKAAVRTVLSAQGANELLTYSFMPASLLQRAGQDAASAYKLSNALSPDLQYYRLSLTPSLLEKVHPNIKAGWNSFALYEIGKLHVLGVMDVAEPAVPAEIEVLSLVVTADAKTAANRPGAAYYQAKKYWQVLAGKLGVPSEFQLQRLDAYQSGGNRWFDQMLQPYEPARSAVLVDRSGTPHGIIGEFKPSVRQAFKLPNYAAGFEIELAALKSDNTGRYVRLPRFPSLTQDICLRVDSGLPYGTVLDLAEKVLTEQIEKSQVYAVEPLDIFQADNDDKFKQVTLRIRITDYQRTLTDAEVSALLEKIAERSAAVLSAQRV